MINNIGAFFAAMPNRDEAPHDGAMHVRGFWEPRMRSKPFEHLVKQHGDGIDTIVIEALRRHRVLFD